MALKLNSSGGGSVTLDPVSTASNVTITIPATNAGSLVTADSSGNITPTVNNTQTLGASGNVWSNVYATTFTGALSGAVTTAAQTNITSVGTLSSLSTSGAVLLNGAAQISGSSSALCIAYSGGGTQFGITIKPNADSTTVLNIMNAAGTSVGSISQTATTATFNGSATSLTTASGAAPSYSARAWVNFNASSTAPVINSNGNVTSITDNGVGRFTVNFITAMPDASYAIAGVCRWNQAGIAASVVSIPSDGTKSTSAATIWSAQSNTNSQFDSADVSAVFFR